MRDVCVRTGVVAALMGLTGAPAFAQQTVQLPDTSQTTTLTASVAEQARVTVPAGVTFDVNDVTAATAATAAAISVQSIVLSTATQQLRVSVQANAAGFTPPEPGATTWDAGDVSWNAASWTNATGAAGSLSNAAYSTVATCDADTSACSTTDLVFSLGAKAAVTRAGSHTLVVTWKFESIGS